MSPSTPAARLDGPLPSAEEALRAYREGASSFVVGLLPPAALALPVTQVLALLEARLGPTLEQALAPANVDPARPAVELPAVLQGPCAGERDGRWLRRANLVGINVRTVGSLWRVVHYALTLPAAQGAIHLLPLFEPGVLGSLYGPASWELNPELQDPELARARPHLHDVAAQLKATVNVLHALGRSVGLDVVPHLDRYAEPVLAQPGHFEWLRREGHAIVAHGAELHREVEARIFAWLVETGPAPPEQALPASAAAFFALDEPARLRLLFGAPAAREQRLGRRVALVEALYEDGYETAPATMAPPFRGLEVDPSPEALHRDERGLLWRDYRIQRPTPMSRVFGPLTRYKLYARRDDNRAWEIDFSRPREATWDYACGHYADVVTGFGFDFMRGDMAHVQMRPQGPPRDPGPRYDLLGAIKQAVVAGGRPWFASFAEAFLGPPGVFGYGDEVDHLEAAGADAALGDLQSRPVDDPAFRAELRRFVDLAATRRFAPSLTAITADKDDPRFDACYRHGSSLRLFLGLLVGDLPSYMGLGFEVRDPHEQPASNEHYSKLYVFQAQEGRKATHGPFQWGSNQQLFATLTRLRRFADAHPELRQRPTRWLLPPDPGEGRELLAWTQPDPAWMFVANTGALPSGRRSLPDAFQGAPLRCALTTADALPDADLELTSNGWAYWLETLAPGECRAYQVAPSRPQGASPGGAGSVLQ